MKNLTKEQEVYFAIAEKINRLRDCNWIDIASGVAEVMEEHYPVLKPQYNRDEYAKAIVKDTEFENKLI